MDLNEYQELARETDELAPSGGIQEASTNEIRYAMGVADEAGEVLGKYKKGIRDSDETVTRSEVIDELGDVLWYVALLSDQLDFPLEEVGARNIEKLIDRKNRQVLAGSGDNR